MLPSGVCKKHSAKFFFHPFQGRKLFLTFFTGLRNPNPVLTSHPFRTALQQFIQTANVAFTDLGMGVLGLHVLKLCTFACTQALEPL